MCFTSKIIPKKKIATEDIVCYKICKKVINEYFSFYKYKQYKLNQTYKLHKKLKIKKIGAMAPYEYNINKGFHSFMNLNTLKKYYNFFINYSDILSICKFIIPKDSIYYEDNLEQVYVSNKIKFIKEII